MSDQPVISPDNLTWRKVWKWVGVLYAAALVGFLIKASAQMGGFAFKWQLVAVLLLPAMHMFWFAIVALFYLAFHRFRIAETENFLRIMAWIYVVVVVMRLISGRPI